MTIPPGAEIRRVMVAVARGKAVVLEGRGVNSSYLVADGHRQVGVKVHCPSRSSAVELRRIQHVDRALQGAAWYPPLIDLGFYELDTEHPVLVAIRPFSVGAPSEDPRHLLGEVTEILGDLAARGAGIEVANDLIGDYASPWLSDRRMERGMASGFLAAQWPDLAEAVDVHISDLRTSAQRLTRPESLAVYHGDLHGRNLIFGGSRQRTVIDWDEAGFSRRPADAGKTLWLSCREGRGDFVLRPAAVQHYLERMHTVLHLPYANACDLAKLGAMWFLPKSDHLTLLEQRDSALASWYLQWISGFWSRYRRNLNVVSRVAAVLEQGARSDLRPTSVTEARRATRTRHRVPR
ncbi:aminoglycoside phosphotransferase family protein [Nocardia sp. NPDC057455]|uniref:aminoglycoside phosphotransferase family protein n=1 Tax=Nocardia sp. NPDC057455 TaxID=3346138 RepID=UPI00366FBBE0